MGPEPQGRDDGHLLRRDQPALHRRHRAAEPGRDLAAVGDRRHPDDALSGRHPQHRVRRRLGQGAGPRRAAGVADRGPAVGLQAHPGRRPDLQGQPGAARPGGQPAGEDQGQQPLLPKVADPLSPITFVDKINVPTSWPASGPTSRPAGTARPWPALHRHAAEVVHLHQRHPRRLAGPGDVQPLVRLPRALRRQGGADPALGLDPGRRAADLPGGDGDLRRDAAARPDPAAADLRGRAGRLRRRWRRFASSSTTAPAAPRPASPIRASSSRSRGSRPGHRGPRLVPLDRRRARARPARAPGADAFTWDADALPKTDFSGDTAAGPAASGPPRRPTTGRRARRAAPSPT